MEAQSTPPRVGRGQVDLYARGWETGYLAAHRDLTDALLSNPALNGRALARLLLHMTRSVRRSQRVRG